MDYLYRSQKSRNLPANNNSHKKMGPIQRVIPRFPPVLTAESILDKAIWKLKNFRQGSRVPNAFIAYRMAVCHELKLLNRRAMTQPQLSSMAKASWAEEPEYVRKEYQRISSEARELYRNIYQIYMPSADLEKKNQSSNSPISQNSMQNNQQEDSIKEGSAIWPSYENSEIDITYLNSSPDMYYNDDRFQEETINSTNQISRLQNLGSYTFQDSQSFSTSPTSENFIISSQTVNDVHAEFEIEGSVHNSPTMFNYCLNDPFNESQTNFQLQPNFESQINFELQAQNFPQHSEFVSCKQCDEYKQTLISMQNRLEYLEQKLANLTNPFEVNY
ncbi:9896_t:CDS:1 [Ambispora leptoticha]|uniref:9896_t:CDS:1 n=1 Tax=Ambispora leptoticha TaxID=144679 RepID=A0A9N8V3L1_9GLOM|nr:9896_t:CDS:1 [Ambispora leptoticha]